MNKPLSTTEFESFISPVEPTPVKPTLTRREKLLRFAKVVRQSGSSFYIYSNLERWTKHALDSITHPNSPWAAAAADPVLTGAGLKGETVSDAMKFFELTLNELHEFSCDCGGSISNKEMARRIEDIAGR